MLHACETDYRKNATTAEYQEYLVHFGGDDDSDWDKAFVEDGAEIVPEAKTIPRYLSMDLDTARARLYEVYSIAEAYCMDLTPLLASLETHLQDAQGDDQAGDIDFDVETAHDILKSLARLWEMVDVVTADWEKSQPPNESRYFNGTIIGFETVVDKLEFKLQVACNKDDYLRLLARNNGPVAKSWPRIIAGTYANKMSTEAFQKYAQEVTAAHEEFRQKYPALTEQADDNNIEEDDQGNDVPIEEGIDAAEDNLDHDMLDDNGPDGDALEHGASNKEDLDNEEQSAKLAKEKAEKKAKAKDEKRKKLEDEKKAQEKQTKSTKDKTVKSKDNNNKKRKAADDGSGADSGTSKPAAKKPKTLQPKANAPKSKSKGRSRNKADTAKTKAASQDHESEDELSAAPAKAPAKSSKKGKADIKPATKKAPKSPPKATRKSSRIAQPKNGQ